MSSTKQTLQTYAVGARSDKRAILGNAQMTRMLFNVTWSTINIGMLVSLEGTTKIPRVPRLVLGAFNWVSGTGEGYADLGGTRDFIGVRTLANDWTYNSGSSPYYTVGAFEKLYRNVSTTTNTVFGTPQSHYLSAKLAIRNLIILSMSKSGGNMSISVSAPITSAAAQTNVSNKTFYDIVHGGSSLPTGYGTTSSDSVTPGWSLTSFSTRPHALNLHWDKATALLHVSEIRIKTT